MEPNNNMVSNQPSSVGAPVPPVTSTPASAPMAVSKKVLAALVGIIVAVAVGFAYVQFFRLPVALPVATTTPTIVTPNSTDVTEAGLYRNEQYGFEFKYPPNWHVSASREIISNYTDEALDDYLSKNGALNHPSDEINIIVMVHPTPSPVSAADYLAGETGAKYSPHVSSEVTIGNNIKAVKAIFEKGEGAAHDITKFFIVASSSIVELSNSNSSNYQQELTALDQILSTFKFIPPANSLANWQTYRNDKYGFEFKYPSTWSLGPTQYQDPVDDQVIYVTVGLGSNFEQNLDSNLQFDIRNNSATIDTLVSQDKIRDDGEVIGYLSRWFGANGKEHLRAYFRPKVLDNNDLISLRATLKDQPTFESILTTFKLTR